MADKIMILPNWDVFKSKFSGRTEKVFEELCYRLFCRKYNKAHGISGYINQSSIEVNPIEFEGKSIGFQAKFYDYTNLADNRDRLVKLIKDVKIKYPKLDEIVIFTHKEWGQAKTSLDGDWRSQAQRKIEDAGKECNLKIEWFDAKKFQSDFVTIDCQDLCEYYFGDWNSEFSSSVVDKFVKQENKIQISFPSNFKQLDLSGLEVKFFEDAKELMASISKTPDLTRSFYAHALANGHVGDLSIYCDPYELSLILKCRVDEFTPHFVILEKMELMWMPEYRMNWRLPPAFGSRSYFRQLDRDDNGIYFLCLIVRRFINEKELIVDMIENLKFDMLDRQDQ